MQITTKEKKDKVLELSVKVVKDDYFDSYHKVLKSYKRDMLLPGFRKGKVPTGIIEKKYGISIMVEEVNKLVQNKLYDYIKENEVKTLGSPIPNIENKIEWKIGSDFNFVFEVGIYPDIKATISKKDKLDFFLIEPEKQTIDNYVNDISKRYGKMESHKLSKEGDVLFCKINQIDGNGEIIKNGITNEASITTEYIDSEKEKNKFISLKQKDKVKANVKKVFTNMADLSAMLNIDKGSLEKLENDLFLFEVKDIKRLTPAKIDKDLFDKLYGKDNVKTKKDFLNKIKEEARTSYKLESDRMLKNDIVIYLMKKTKISLPDEFLKRWLQVSSKNPISSEDVEKEYEMYSKSLKWQIIENKIIEDNNLKADENEIKSFAKNLVKNQMVQYGRSDISDKELNDISQNIMKNEDEKKKIIDQLYDKKTLDHYKKSFSLKSKKISYDDFVKLATEKNK